MKQNKPNALDRVLQGSTRSLQRCQCECCIRSLSLALGPTPSTRSAAQRWPLNAPIPGWLQDSAGAVPYLITRSHSVSGILAASQFNPFCSWTFLSPMTDHSSVTNCHCGAVLILISSSCILWYDFIGVRKKENGKHRK